MNPTEASLVYHYNKFVDYYSPINANMEEISNRLGIVYQGNSFLDLGCGTGFFCAFAKARGASVIGVDYAEERVKEGTRTYHLGLVYADIHEWLDRAQQEPNPDYVTLWDVIEHLENPLSLIAKCRRWQICASIPINHPYVAHLQVWKTYADLAADLCPDSLNECVLDGRHYALCKWEPK